MSYTKGQIVRDALTELGISEYEFDISPEELTSGVSRLDSMLAQWSRKGVKISYNFVGDSSDDSGLPNTFREAVITNLAIRLAPSYGKQPAMGVMALAKDSMNDLLRESAAPIEKQFQEMPVGSGYKNSDPVFFTPKFKEPQEMTNFQDYSGASTAIQRGDVGTAIRLSISGSADISEVVSSSIHYRKPSGKTGQWTGSISGDAIEYITQSGDIDEAGVWYLQAQFDLGSWQGSSKVTSITVGESLIS
jgi:hypothetical protein